MRKLLLITIYNCTFLSLMAQMNVCVLVDISKSIKSQEILNAKQFVKDILMGSAVNTTIFLVDGTLPDMKMKTGDKLMIMPFGDRSCVMDYSPLINTISNPNDVANYIEQYFPVKLTSDWTYITLAKARLAEIASKNQMSEYSLIFVSDNTSDDYGGHSNYAPYEQLLVDSYNTNKNPVSERPGVRGKLIANPKYSIFVQKVDVSKYTPPPGGIPVTDTLPKTLKIELTSLKGGTVKNPCKLKENKFSISWFCKNAPPNAAYKISIKTTGEKSQIIQVNGNSYSFSNIKDGQSRITVSADNFIASSANTVVETSGGDLTWLLWLFVFAALIGGGYWYWNKQRQDKMRNKHFSSDDDVFSHGSSSNKDSSDSSDYF
jgi:hypothetical protein